MLRKVIQGLVMLGIVLSGSSPVFGGDPQWMYQQPVKLDASGQPIYNSWQSREQGRQNRTSDRSSIVVTSGANSGQVIPVPQTNSGSTQMPIPLNQNLQPAQVHTQSVPAGTSESNQPKVYQNAATRAAGDSAISPGSSGYIQVNEQPVPVSTGSDPSQ